MGATCCQNELKDGKFEANTLHLASQQYKPYLQKILNKQLPVLAQLKTGNKEIVSGDWKQNQAHTGKGVIYWQEKFYYQGWIVEGKAKGEGKIMWPNRTSFKGRIENGRAAGKGVFSFGQKNNQLIGEWVNGFPKLNQRFQLIKDGKKGIIIFSDETLSRKEEEFFKGTLYVKIQFGNGVNYEGQVKYKNGAYKIDGKGTLRYSDGSYYNGDFQEGKMHGRGKYYWSTTGHWFEGEYKNNLKEGKGKYYYNYSEFQEGEWVNGVYKSKAAEDKAITIIHQASKHT